MAITILSAVIALLAGLTIGWFWGRSRLQTVMGRRLTELTASRDVFKSQLAMMASQRDDERRLMKQQMAEQARQYEQRFAQQSTLMQQQMQQQMALIKEQMNAASEKILQHRQLQLSQANEQQLSGILNPLKESIRLMREAVEKSDREQTATMERLDASIKENLRQAQQVGERADKLAQALTSENKAQGNFGELRLRQLLDQMGLERGLQYEEQTTLRRDDGTAITDDEGHRLIPDVVLHFPDKRDVVIDSKVSLTAFEDYFTATTDDARAAALRRHVASVRQHVGELAHKNYSHYLHEGRQQLDFVVMYVFSESALQLALSADVRLWREAYDQGVVIAGSQSLFVMLRVLEMSWRQMWQVENQQEIMQQANIIVDRVQLFYERLAKADEQLHRTVDAFDDLRRSTAPTGQSITTAAQKLLKYGAEENPKRKKTIR